MDTSDRILKAVDGLYGAALDPTLWPAALDSVACLTGGVGAIVLSISTASSASISSNALGEAASDYADNGWWSRDALREGANRLGLGTGLYSHRELVSEETIKRDPFFQEFLRRHGLHAMATYAFRPRAESLLTVTVPRATGRGDFDSSEAKTLRILGPHVARAVAIAGQVAHPTFGSAQISPFLDRFEFAAVLVDRKLRVRTLNRTARSMIDDGFAVERGVLRAKTAAGQRALEDAVQACFGTPLIAQCRHVVPRSEGRPALLVRAIRLGRETTASILDLLAEDLALIVFTDTTVVSPADPTTSLRAMGLTPAEARVAAAFGSGGSTNEIAESLNITVGTLRIHLKAIFGKLDLRRQSDLTRLVARLTVLQ